MSRLIDADALEDVLVNHGFCYCGENEWNNGVADGFLYARDDVKEAPTIDAEPTRHGKWIWEECVYKCSECSHKAYGNILECMDGTYKYCPNCGARMDEDEISNIAKESADKISKALEKVRAKGMQKQNIKEDDKP